MKFKPIKTIPKALKDGRNVLGRYEISICGASPIPVYVIMWWDRDPNDLPKSRKKHWLTGSGDEWSTGYYYTPIDPTHYAELEEPEQQEIRK